MWTSSLCDLLRQRTKTQLNLPEVYYKCTVIRVLTTQPSNRRTSDKPSSRDFSGHYRNVRSVYVLNNKQKKKIRSEKCKVIVNRKENVEKEKVTREKSRSHNFYLQRYFNKGT